MTNVINKVIKNGTEYQIYAAGGATVNPATSTTSGTVKLGSDTVQTVAANSPSSTTGKTYPVQLNGTGQAVVNVPRTDTQTVTSVNGQTGVVSVGTITSVKMNGSTVSSSGEADLGTVITSHQDISGKADISDVLTKTNTTSYTPTADYHPSTKKYVDDIVGDIETLLAAL